MHFFVVHHQAIHIVGEQISNGAGQHIHVLVHTRRRFAPGDVLDDLLPGFHQTVEIIQQLLFVAAFGDGADDDAEAVGFDLAADALQPALFTTVVDLARNADRMIEWNQHQKTAGQGDVGGHPSALVGDRLFGDLHQDRLPLMQVMIVAAAAVVLRRLALLLVKLAELGEIVADVGKMEKGILRQADVDKSRLHALENFGHLAIIYIPHHTFFFCFLKIQLREPAVFTDRQTGFTHRRVYKNFFLHGPSIILMMVKVFSCATAAHISIGVATRSPNWMNRPVRVTRLRLTDVSSPSNSRVSTSWTRRVLPWSIRATSVNRSPWTSRVSR
ncbi:MAG: hypothetical protein BWY83_02285 [bacterium ADurb.Bin478]|nr:MAG: hypothetical protein BWY83_02285 [bacterium ADurb.Bin478]